jgi:hypothetical protein
MKSMSQTKILSLRIHDALAKGRISSNLDAYECTFDRPLSELTGVENKLAHLSDPGIQVRRNNFAR